MGLSLTYSSLKTWKECQDTAGRGQVRENTSPVHGSASRSMPRGWVVSLLDILKRDAERAYRASGPQLQQEELKWESRKDLFIELGCFSLKQCSPLPLG